jgi:hypothetical protein
MKKFKNYLLWFFIGYVSVNILYWLLILIYVLIIYTWSWLSSHLVWLIV